MSDFQLSGFGNDHIHGSGVDKGAFHGLDHSAGRLGSDYVMSCFFGTQVDRFMGAHFDVFWHFHVRVVGCACIQIAGFCHDLM